MRGRVVENKLHEYESGYLTCVAHLLNTPNRVPEWTPIPTSRQFSRAVLPAHVME